MAVESGARASNTLTGELKSRPLAILIAGASERGTSGTFTFTHGKRRDVLTLRRGKIAVVRTSDPIGYLGGILFELGAIDMTTLDDTLREIAHTKRLHGEVLLERGAITRERLEEALAEQSFRKTHHLFSLPEDAKWYFREDVDELQGARDENRPAIETWPALWRGLCDQTPGVHVERTLAKVDGGIHLKDLRSIDRFSFAKAERALCVQLHEKPITLPQLMGVSKLGSERTTMLVYVLALARAIVRIEVAPVGPVDLGVEGVRVRAKAIDAETPHAILGVRQGVSHEAARAAYFRLARLWHPDKLPRGLLEVRSECDHVFRRLGEAHRALTDIGERLTIDALVGGDAVAANDSVRPPAFAPRATMQDVVVALSKGDVTSADAIARTLTSAGAIGPDARAVVAWCSADAGRGGDEAKAVAAIAALDAILTGDPECVRALYYRGQLAKGLGREEQALRDFRKAARLDPSHPDVQRELQGGLRHASVAPPRGSVAPPRGSVAPPRASILPPRAGASVVPPRAWGSVAPPSAMGADMSNVARDTAASAREPRSPRDTTASEVPAARDEPAPRDAPSAGGGTLSGLRRSTAPRAAGK